MIIHRFYNITNKVMFFVLPFFLLILFSQNVFAQGTPVNRSINIIKSNPLKPKGGLQGDVSLLFGYDSNISYGSGDTDPYEEIVPGLSVFLSPSIKWTTEDLHRKMKASSRLNYGTELRINAHALYAPDSVFNSLRTGFTGKAVLFYNPGKHFKLQLFEQLNRIVDPHYLFKDTFTQTWYKNQTGVGMVLVPGGGLLESVLRYTFEGIIFEDSTVSSANRLGNNFDFRTTYSFLPKSSLWVTSQFSYYAYLDDSSRNSMPIKLYAGITTPLWLNFVISLGGGYGWGLYSSGSSPQTWLATAAIYYNFINKMIMSVKYSHSFEDSLLGSYTDKHNISLNTYIPFASKMYFTLQAGASYLNTADIYYINGASGPSSRGDVVLFSTFITQYKLRKDLLLGLKYRFSLLQTDYRLTTGVHPPTTPPTEHTVVINNPSFMKHQVFLTLSYLY